MSKTLFSKTHLYLEIIFVACFLFFWVIAEEGAAQTLSKEKQEIDSLLAEMSYYVELYPDSVRILSQQLLGKSRRINYDYGIARSINNIGESYYWQRNYDTAGIYFLKSLSLVKKEPQSFMYALAISNYAEIVEKKGNKDSAFIYHSAALKIFKELKDFRHVALRELSLGLIEWRRGKNIEALNHFLTALDHKAECGDVKVIASIQNNIGVVYYRFGNYEKALDAYNEALVLRQSIQYIKGIVITSNNIGLIFLKLNSFKKAYEKFSSALKVAKENNFLFGIGYSSLNLAEWNLLKKMYGEAIPFANEAIRSYSTYRELNSVAIAMNLLGRAYVGLKRYDLALKTFNAALDSSNLVKDSYSRLITLQNIAQLQIKMNAPKEALKNLFETRRYATEEKRKDVLLENYQMTATAYEIIGNYKLAFEFEKKYNTLKDSLAFDEIGNRLAIWNASYDSRKQQEENYRLMTANELNAIELGNLKIMQQWLIFIIVIVTFFMLLLGGLLYYIRKISKQIFLQKNNLEIANAQLEEAMHTADQQKEIAEAANQQKTELISIVTHDLKNPLTSIRGGAQTMIDYAAEPEVTAEMLPIIVESSNKMLALINQLLESSRLESFNFVLQKKEHELPTILESVARMNKTQADIKRQKIMLHHTFENHQTVSIDKEKIISALDNLISNAIKYSPHNSVIKITAGCYDSRFKISVKDEGPGLTEQDKEKVFGKFQKLSAKPTGGESSTGLGLSIVKRIVELHDGKVWIESEYGKGSEFIIELPLNSN